MTDEQLSAFQVIENLDGKKIRIYHILPDSSHIGDDDDPLTTIVVDGYEDQEP
jgi:hypothetical protein